MAEFSIDRLYPRSMKYLSEKLLTLVQKRIWLKIIVAMFLGVAIGVLLGPEFGLIETKTSAAIGNWLALPGRFFLTLIQMIVIPLIIASIVRGIAAAEDIEQLKKIGIKIIFFFVSTTTLAVLIGVGVSVVVKPGEYIERATVQQILDSAPHASVETPAPKEFTISPQTILSIFPNNPFDAMVQSNTLQIVVFALVIGIAVIAMPVAQAKPMIELLGSIQEICMTIVRWVMRLAPLAVFGLIAQMVMKLGIAPLYGMAVYVATVILGLLLLFIAYLVIVFVVARVSPFAFVRATKDVLLLAFSTSSSAAVMPLTIKTAEEKLHVRPTIAQVVIPLGATLNMNGTALYQGVATIFLAQLYHIDIGLPGLIAMVVVAVGSSIGSPAAPGVGIAILSLMLTSAGVPLGGIALIMGVDRIVDMCRTAINVAGDLVACKVMDHTVGSKKTLEIEIAEQDERELRHQDARRSSQ